MIPLSDSPRDPTHIPWLTGLLVFANSIVGGATLPRLLQPWSPDTSVDLPRGYPVGGLSELDRLLLEHGFQPVDPNLPDLAASLFLHVGVIHLAGNLLYLWIYGPNVERRLGRFAFLLLYLTAGVLGSSLYALTSAFSEIPMVGASGAISGLLGAYLVFFPRNEIKVLFFWRTIHLPAWIVLLLFVLVDNLVPWWFDRTTPVAHAAHLGGFFAGALLALGVTIVQTEDAPPEPVADPFADARRLWRQGLVHDAYHALSVLAQSGDPEVAARARTELKLLESEPAFQRGTLRR